MGKGRWVGAAVVVAGLVAGCSDGGGDAQPSVSTSSPNGAASGSPSSAAPTGGAVKLAVAGTVATGIEVPWGLAFLPDKSALVTERDSGKIKRVVGGQVSDVGTVEGVDPSSEGGLLGIAVDPQYPKRPYVYVYYSSSDDNRIARLNYTNGAISEPTVILEGIPQAAIHNGGRIRFGPDGFLYAGTGDGGDRPNSQNDESLGGKILRITTEGKAAPGNPDGRLWITKGHRNVQGLAFEGSQLYSAEFGQNTWDEVNAITPGSNYGWPAAEGVSQLDGMVDPIGQWSTADASPSGIAFSQGHVFMAGLRGERLWAIPVAGGKSTGTPVAFFEGRYGRLRTVETAPDGSLWLTTSNTDGRGDVKSGDDRILRVTVSR
ncbi:PQQ-dependent sugar dehydrogenase [Kribbella sp. CA-293567]|uniref:PQQ-dependent sugar dehydrogenase n=1 Tax=Kribbella sp. CA-293567 TaxID=3002436 RepID=UPI0022DCE577|nr:PQQ-dependent sugar dehydrogenase [Kribbella sp. CA-293567]WBQ07541.1 PQQ-dependent sugar dehydrogenase [Kribbella sp. CA-293567]